MKPRRVLFFYVLAIAVASLVSSFLYCRQGYTYLDRAQRELNRLYRERRPFAYRWPGAAAGGPITNECQIPLEATRWAAAAIDKAERKSGQTLEVLQLSGRLALLQGRFEDALASYRRALYLSHDNTEIELELGITYAVRAKCERWPVDYESAIEHMLTAEEASRSSAVVFDIAVLFADIGLPHASLEHWQSVVKVESSSEWRQEGYLRLAEVQRGLTTWNLRLHHISQSPISYLAHINEADGSIEVVLTAAVQDWLPMVHRDPATDTALTQLALALHQSGDLWLADLLKIPATPTGARGLGLLADASRANNAGEHVRAAKAALQAEKAFHEVGNIAGILRSRIELAYSLDRTWQHSRCLEVTGGLRDEAAKKNYTWIAAQAWLEKISCSTQTRQADVIADCEAAYKSISSTQYTGLRLRALSFLTEQYFSFDRRLRVWSYGLQGLQSFWGHPLPSNRGYTFYYTMGSSARSAGNGRAALALLREGIGILKDSTYRQLYALALSDLGEWEFEQGFHDETKRTFDEMDRVFSQLDTKETTSFRRLAETARARLEINAGEAKQGLARLTRTLDSMEFPYTSLSPTERRLILPVFGSGYLRSGDLHRAKTYYDRAIRENATYLKAMRDPAQRENAQQEIDRAWKGQTEVFLREGRDLKALKVWETFRGSRLVNQSSRFLTPPSGVSFLVYAFLPTGLSGWVRNANGVEQKWLGGIGIREAIRHFSLLVADPNSPPAQVDAESEELYRLLISPFESRLNNTSLLIIDAEGPLAAIPWPALRNEHGVVILEKFAVTQTIGWTEAISHFDQRKLDTSHGLIVSNPAIREDLRKRFPSLTDARWEADWLERRLPSPTVYREETATVENLLKQLPYATSFHFAGHGVSYGGFGALLLASSSRSDEGTKYVTASELAKLKLTALQLVVLSACSSGVGEHDGTVNLDSLVRGFLDAGAWRVVAVRWNVRSQPSTDIIVEFYRRVLQGNRPAEALRQAVLAFRRNDPTLPPYYWAGFQVFGSP